MVTAQILIGTTVQFLRFQFGAPMRQKYVEFLYDKAVEKADLMIIWQKWQVIFKLKPNGITNFVEFIPSRLRISNCNVGGSALRFFKVSKRTKKKRPNPETFTFFQPKQVGPFKYTEDLMVSSRLDTKIVSYQNSLLGKKLKPTTLPIEEHSLFASNDSEQQFSLFSNEEI